MPEMILLTPGPTTLPPRVAAALTRPMINPRTPEFGRVMTATLAGLRDVFQTRNDVIPLVASGTGGLEASIVNFLSPGDRALCVSNGFFSERYAEIADRYGVRVDHVSAEWGRPVPAEAIAERLRGDRHREYRAVLMTQSETTTGVHNDVRAIRALLGDHPALLMVDAISSLAAIPLETDAWGVDVVVGASQKGLMSPPGMAFLSVSERAWQVAEANPAPRFYFDLRRGRKEVHATFPSTPFTVAVSVVYAVHEALQLIAEEGLPQVFDRHRRMARLVRTGVRAMGLEVLPDEASAVDTVTPVRLPDGAEPPVILAHARERYGVYFAAGIGRLNEHYIRIGHVGYTTAEMLLRGLEGLGRTLNDLGFPVETEAGLRAGRQSLEAVVGR